MGAGAVYDICFLGMGDDCHTLSLFPHSPLLTNPPLGDFAAIDAGEKKGWRLTLLPAGLARCGRILILVTGKAKAEALQSVFEGPENALERPIQFVRGIAQKVFWLVDEAAAGKLAVFQSKEGKA
jgi:6-phosphogluconolactonase